MCIAGQRRQELRPHAQPGSSFQRFICSALRRDPRGNPTRLAARQTCQGVPHNHACGHRCATLSTQSHSSGRCRETSTLVTSTRTTPCAQRGWLRRTCNREHWELAIHTKGASERSNERQMGTRPIISFKSGPPHPGRDPHRYLYASSSGRSCQKYETL